MPSRETQFDDIVVGGGTAGAVIAARLSEQREKRVLLLEAGPDYPDIVPPQLLDATFAVTSGHNWNMNAIVREKGLVVTGQQRRISRVFELLPSSLPAEERLHPPPRVGQATVFPYLQGKVIGGGSSINGCLALHARPEDYANWSAAGNEDWSWERVQPFIGRLATADGSKPALPVEIPSSEDLTLCQKGFLETCRALGKDQVDLGQGTIAGVGPIPKSVRGGNRVSTSALYLAAARSRVNLTIRSNCLVDRLLLEPRNGLLTAIGVEVLSDGIPRRFSGRHITLSAGAINSPAILLRSGVGGTGQLERSHIKPVLDLPGVGQNLQDHPAVSIWATPKSGSCFTGEPVHQLMLQEKSTVSHGLCDIQLYMLSAVRTCDLPGLRQMASSELAIGVAAVLATPRSAGYVEVVDRDPTRNPRIHLNCLCDSEDLRRMKEGVRSAWHILRQEPLNLCVDRILLWTQKIINSDSQFESLIRTTVRSTWHPVGTLRMGTAGDAMSVVDQCGRLYGCRNVAVADASIMPTIPSVPLSLTCMVIGERIAAHLRELEA